MIVDFHVHVARELTGFLRPLRYGQVTVDGQIRQFLPPSFDPTASPPEVLLGYMDQVGVDRACMVQHWSFGDQNATFVDAIRRWPDRLSGLAGLGPLDQPDAADQLERLLAAGLAGLKVELPSTRRLRPGFRFDGEPERKVWERLARLGGLLVLDVNPGTAEDFAALGRMLDEYPGIRFVICHAFAPERSGWQERLQMARHPRVWVDLAALPLMLGNEEYPYPKSREVVRRTVEALGADRVLWGTDYPGLLNLGTYRQLLDWVRVHCDFLTTGQRDAVLGGNAARLLRATG